MLTFCKKQVIVLFSHFTTFRKVVKVFVEIEMIEYLRSWLGVGGRLMLARRGSEMVVDERRIRNEAQAKIRGLYIPKGWHDGACPAWGLPEVF